MKPPRKVPKIDTTETDPTVRNTSSEEGTAPRRNLPGIGTSEPTTDPSGIRQPGGDPDNTPREPQITVEDIATPEPPETDSAGATADIKFLSPTLISRLTTQPDGLRQDKLGRLYAEIENEGVTMIRRREDGEYQAGSSNTLTATGPLLERIAETAFWRRKNTVLVDETPRVTDPMTQPSPAQDLSPALWQNWGSSVKPQSVETLEINGLHYRVVPGLQQNAEVAFLQHPRFSPSRYEAFEHMLQDDPSLQPRWTVKKNSQWEVPQGHLPFEKSLTRYVADTFKDLADSSLNSVARELFNRANHSNEINSMGLLVLKQTFRHWADPNNAAIPRRELADPLLMLPPLPRTEGAVVLRPESSGTLQRLDFDPVHFPTEWANFSANASNFNLKRLVGSVLIRNGYDVFPMTKNHEYPALVFTRANHDSVFFMKLFNLHGTWAVDPTFRDGPLFDPYLTNHIGEPAVAALRAAHDQGKAVWLNGGTQITSQMQSVFILREQR